MLKKKNIAMVMAAATVATSVAPVFAAVNVENVNEANLIAEVEKLLAKKYSDSEETGNGETIGTNEDYKNSVYSIKATTEGTVVEVTSVKHLKEIIESVKVNAVTDTSVELSVEDKGHKEVDGKIVANETTNKRFYGNDFTGTVEGETLNKLLLTEANLNKVGAELLVEETRTAITTENSYKTIKLANGTEIEVAANDYMLDLTKPVDANGNLITVPTTGELDPATAKRVVGFKEYEATTKKKQNIPSIVVSELKYETKNTIKIEKNASELITSDGYTTEGAELVNAMIDAKEGHEFVVNGVKYDVTLTNKTEENLKVEAVKNGGYKLDLVLTVNKAGKTENTENVVITITGDVQKDLSTIRAAILENDKVVDVDGKVAKLAGDDRFSTAVEISKETYLGLNDKNDTDKVYKEHAGAIILVGEEAIVDGLAAAPLAKSANAPILLTKKDAVPSSTMNEIKRLVDKGGKVYLVGGENNISKEVEKQLVSEMNAEIVRLAGDDRNETSLKIAEELKEVKGGDFEKHYIVGGDGLADAMSIAAIAAEQEAPILVTPAAELTKGAKKFLEENNEADVTVIGGESKVSTQVLKDAKAKIAAGKKVNRIAGEDRHDTNAKVIATLADVENVYVAKSGYVPQNGDALLVDALAAAPLAARTNGAIVLATDDVTTAQEAAVKKAVTKGANNKLEAKLTQVGGGVNANIIQKLVKLLGL